MDKEKEYYLALDKLNHIVNRLIDGWETNSKNLLTHLETLNNLTPNNMLSDEQIKSQDTHDLTDEDYDNKFDVEEPEVDEDNLVDEQIDSVQLGERSVE